MVTGPLLLVLLLGGAIHARAEVIFLGGPEMQSWPLIRKSFDFTWNHPLLMLHGHVDDITGELQHNPKDWTHGHFISLRGKRNGLSFDEMQGGPLVAQLPADEWTFQSKAFFPTGPGRLAFQGLFRTGNFRNPLYVTAQCETSEVIRCTVADSFDLAKWDWDLPMLMKLPIRPVTSVQAEFVFGPKP